jgi:hypothetical protein
VLYCSSARKRHSSMSPLLFITLGRQGGLGDGEKEFEGHPSRILLGGGKGSRWEEVQRQRLEWGVGTGITVICRPRLQM